MAELKKIAALCVTYHSHKELEVYVRSLANSFSHIRNEALLDIYVMDNTEVVQPQPVFEDNSAISYHFFHYSDNPGYFGAVHRLMLDVDVHEYDYVIISNVDLVVDESLFSILLSKEYGANVGWIATTLFSKKEQRDRNPEIRLRYSRFKLRLLALKFRIPLLDVIYNKTLYKRKKLKHTSAPMEIYAGHGSFILLTSSYFTKCGIIAYPMFLFCEELYLAEKCRAAGLTVQYDPALKIFDNEHVSSGNIRRGLSYRKSAYYKYNYNSVVYILKTFYR